MNAMAEAARDHLAEDRVITGVTAAHEMAKHYAARFLAAPSLSDVLAICCAILYAGQRYGGVTDVTRLLDYLTADDERIRGPGAAEAVEAEFRELTASLKNHTH